MSQLRDVTVKAGGAAPKSRSPFDGWQLGVLAVVIAWGGALLVVPRSATPDTVPLPAIAPTALGVLARREHALAEQARNRDLALSTRRLGSSIRAIGRAEAESHDAPADLRERTKRAAAEAVRREPDQVVALRAYQTELLLKALYAWSVTGVVSDDLVELGGDLLDTLDQNGWIDVAHRRRTVLLDELALRALIKQRWNDLAGLTERTFALEPDEQRAIIAAVIERSLANLPAEPDPADAYKKTPLADALIARLSQARALDPSYPFEFAAGIVYYRTGAFSASVDAFARYLQATPDGPYVMRARNFMKAAIDHAGTVESL